MATTSPLGLRYPALTGVTPNVPRDLQALAEDVQQAIGSLSAGLQEGVIDAGSFEVTQASGGASMTLDIASNVGSGAYVDEDGLSPDRVGRYYVPPTAAKSTVTVATAHATLPRVDAIVVSLAGVVSIVTGTATSGATLDNARDGSHGGAAIPSDALHLADALVPATDTTISNSQIRDRRKWARGVNLVIPGTGGGNITTTNIGGDELTTFSRRIECSGLPVLIEFTGNLKTTSGQITSVVLDIDGSSVTSFYAPTSSDTAPYPAVIRHVLTSAGSHTVRFRLATSSGTGTLYNTGTQGLPCVTIREVVAQNSGNNTTTTG